MDNLFASSLAMARGNASAAASHELRRVLEAVAATGLKGSITVKLEFVPKDGDDGCVVIKPTIKTAIPQQPMLESVAFITPDFGLDRQDPRQAEMFEERRRQGVTTLEEKRAGVPGNIIAAG